MILYCSPLHGKSESRREGAPRGGRIDGTDERRNGRHGRLALALPRQVDDGRGAQRLRDDRAGILRRSGVRARRWGDGKARERETSRSEEHTSELQSRPHLVCRLLLEKKKK